MNQQQNNDNNSDIAPITGPEAKALGVEYGELMIAESLSEAQAERMAEILDLAITHNEVDFWVAHFTCSVGMETGLLSQDDQDNFEDQKAMLREHLGQANLPHIRVRPTVSIETRLQVQMKLHATKALLAATDNATTPNDPN
jgi:hypothetical protein